MFREGLRPPDPFQEKSALETARTQDGMSLKSMSELGPVLVVCLPSRPAKWLERVSAERSSIESGGTRIVLVFPDDDPQLPDDLKYVARIADPKCALYKAFGLGEREAGLLRRMVGGGPEQEPGVFLMVDGEVTRSEPELFVPGPA